MIVDATRALAALRAQHKAIDMLLARLIVADQTFLPTQSGAIWAAVEQGHAMILSLEQELD